MGEMVRNNGVAEVGPLAVFFPSTCARMALLGLDLGFWCAMSWQLVEGFLCIPKRMGIGKFSLCLLPEVLAEVC